MGNWKLTYDEMVKVCELVNRKERTLNKDTNVRTKNHLDSLDILKINEVPHKPVPYMLNEYNIDEINKMFDDNNINCSFLGFKMFTDIRVIFTYYGKSFNEFVHKYYPTLKDNLTFLIYYPLNRDRNLRMAIVQNSYSGVKIGIDLPISVLDSELRERFFAIRKLKEELDDGTI